MHNNKSTEKILKGCFRNKPFQNVWKYPGSNILNDFVNRVYVLLNCGTNKINRT